MILRFAIAALLATPAAAGEVFGGLAAHGIDLGLVAGRYEGGVDLVAGVRSVPILRVGAIDLRLHAFGSVNLDGGVNFAVAGGSLRVPIGRFYIQPGVGLAVHDGRGDKVQTTPDDLYLGSRLLLAPELTLGLAVSRRWAIEVAYLHLSHAQLGGRQNPGLDTIGARLVYRFGR